MDYEFTIHKPKSVGECLKEGASIEQGIAGSMRLPRPMRRVVGTTRDDPAYEAASISIPEPNVRMW